ncbi:MAG: hypothetical protein DRJ65_03850 [Acidobacteria bacterium]|nr:MAG: hypothetical protein DRJ65_03850 [Acidobacteriota bacterium]
MARALSVAIVGFVLLVALMAALPVAASVSDTELFLPAVGTGAGVPPSYWYTTIWVFNPNEGPAEVEFSFLRRNQSNTPSDVTSSITVGGGVVVQIDDAVTTMFGVQGFGAIRAVADVPVHLTARIYSQATGQEERDSSGQAFAAVPAQRAIGSGEESDLIGLTNLVGGDFRYNVGFVETTGQQVSVDVSLFGRSGGSWVTRTIQLRPFEQMQMSVDELFNNAIGESDNFRLRVSGRSGDGRVIVFGSRVANGSQDATTFEMTFPPLP